MFRGKSTRAIGGEHHERTDAVLLQSKGVRLGNGKIFFLFFFDEINFIVDKIFSFFPFIETLIHSKNKRKRPYLCSVYSFTITKMR